MGLLDNQISCNRKKFQHKKAWSKKSTPSSSVSMTSKCSGIYRMRWIPNFWYCGKSKNYTKCWKTTLCPSKLSTELRFETERKQYTCIKCQPPRVYESKQEYAGHCKKHRYSNSKCPAVKKCRRRGNPIVKREESE